MLTEKQTRYIGYLEAATDLIDAKPRLSLGCCCALVYTINPGTGPERWRINVPQDFWDLKDFLEEIFRENNKYVYWWPLTEEGALQRILALSFLIDIIETENLFAD